MKALRLYGQGRLVLEETPIPEPGPGEKLMKVTCCSLCRTDAKMWSRGQRDLVLPRVLGHEMSVCDPSTGQNYGVWPAWACGTCPACLDGRENMCPEIGIIGFHRDGALAEWIVVPETSLIPLPLELKPEIASLAEPMACGINALEKLSLTTGETVLILGGGPVGMLTALAARDIGAEPFILEVQPERIERCREFLDKAQIGAGLETDDKYHTALNAAPDPNTFTTGLHHLAPEGRFCLFSGLVSDDLLPAVVLNEIHYRQLTVTGAYGATFRQIQAALDILNRHRDAAALLIDRTIFPGQVEETFQEILNSQVMKTIVTMSG